MTIGLGISTSFLVHRLNKYFSKRIKYEARRLKVIFYIFTAAYTSRMITYFVVTYGDLTAFQTTMTYTIGYIFWDFIPLILVQIYHHRGVQTKLEDEPDEDLLSMVSSGDIVYFIIFVGV